MTAEPSGEADPHSDAEVIYAATQRYEAECEDRRQAASQRAFGHPRAYIIDAFPSAAGYVDAIAAALADLR
ncbi:MAG: hypothetical protein JWN61_1993 [Pseudonocardiales bacterium]|nr:hypothetical protein [Pseudonocardiales bacterium]